MARLFSCIVAALFSTLGGCAAVISPGGMAPPAQYNDGISSATAMPQSAIPGPIPVGFIGFCLRNADQCDLPDKSAATAQLTRSNWELLNQVNRVTNATIKYEDDDPHYGITEYWTIATDGYGDCEDFALTKRKALIDAGLPVAALRIALVLTSANERHAILTVATDRGDYVLDSISDEVRPWTQTSYKWLERQDPKKHWGWDRLNEDTSGSQSAVAAGPR